MKRTIWAAALTAALLLAADADVENARKMVKEGKYEQAITALDAAYKAKPKSAEVKTALVDAHMAHGDFNMNNAQLPPFRKYPAALRAYRQVLRYDASNAKAKQNIDMIESIYKQMGRPVPQ